MAPSPLEALPTELLFAIIAYTSPLSLEPPSALRLPPHPLVALSATSTHLHALTEEYARILLHKHAPNLLPPPPPPPAKRTKQPKNAVPRTNHRKKWLRWLESTCRHCLRPSRRRAILDRTTTCCAPCDKKLFPKMTMTQASTTHHLSKLDLFTPNTLHPSLPPLSLGAYTCMGSETIMFSAPDVLARRAHIRACLAPDKADDGVYLRRRVAAHERLIMHMGIQHVVEGTTAQWMHILGGNVPLVGTVRRSMASREAREEYVRVGLKREREAMLGGGSGGGVVEGGSGESVEEAIKIE